jgi:hypothetical protein
MKIRKTCEFKDCTSSGRNIGSDKKGNKLWGRYCDKHHRNRYPGYKRESIDNRQCVICGWSEGPCDRHRIIPKLGYIQSNIRVLCPNHHRLVTYNIITVS